MSKTRKLIPAAIILMAIFAAAYFLFIKPAENKPPQPLSVSTPVILWTDNRTLSVLFSITNPNKNWGAEDYSYNVNLYNDRGVQVKSLQKSLFIYAAETEVLAETKIDTGGNIIASSSVSISGTNWVPASEFKKPLIKNQSLEVSKKDSYYSVNIRMLNPNDFDISKIVATAVLYSTGGQELAVTRQDSESIKAKREKGLISFVSINPSMEKYLDLPATKYYIYIKK